jgi:hypothetical protein
MPISRDWNCHSQPAFRMYLGSKEALLGEIQDFSGLLLSRLITVCNIA